MPASDDRKAKPRKSAKAAKQPKASGTVKSPKQPKPVEPKPKPLSASAQRIADFRKRTEPQMTCRGCGSPMVVGTAGLGCESMCGKIIPLSQYEVGQYREAWPERVMVPGPSRTAHELNRHQLRRSRKGDPYLPLATEVPPASQAG